MEIVRVKGVYTFEQIFGDGRRIITKFENAITQNYFSAIHQFLCQSTSLPEVGLLNISHLAFGLGTTPATRNDSLLETEDYRKAFASRTFTNTILTVKTNLAAGEWNPAGGYIKEVGIFAGATDTANSGLMLSRTVVNVQKNENIQLIVTWELRQV